MVHTLLFCYRVFCVYRGSAGTVAFTPGSEATGRGFATPDSCFHYSYDRSIPMKHMRLFIKLLSPKVYLQCRAGIIKSA